MSIGLGAPSVSATDIGNSRGRRAAGCHRRAVGPHAEIAFIPRSEGVKGLEDGDAVRPVSGNEGRARLVH